MSHAYVRQLVRSVVVLSAIIAFVGGVTYAALLSQPGVIRNNTISTAVANLKVSNTDGNYSNLLEGYSFGNLIPGGNPAPNGGYVVYLLNDGTTPLNASVSIGSGLVNTDNVDLSKVHLLLTPLEGGAAQSYTVKDLVAANTTGGIPLTANGHLIPTERHAFMLQVSLDSDAVSGPSASISKVDISFGAVAVN